MRGLVSGLVTLVLVIFFLVLVYNIWDEYYTPNNRILKCIDSPDNKYTACVFVRDFGATTRESYHLAILKKGKGLGNSSGNVYISYGKFEVEWVKPDALKVIRQNGTVFKQVTHFEDIQITYPD